MPATGITSQSIQSVNGGISKVSPLLRHPSQLEDIDNGYFSGTEGLIKRPPMILKKKLDIASLTSTSKPFMFPIDRGDGNEYVGVIHDGALSIIDVNNPTVPQTVTYTNQSYLDLASGTPRGAFKAITIMDYTIILNTTKVTAFRPYYWTASNPTASDEDPIHDIVQLFSDLPAINGSHDGKVIEIVGDMSVTTDNYYVKGYHQAVNPEEVWRETRRPNILHTFDNTTLPHSLKKTGANSWAFAPITWNDRLVGDEVSNPAPSFMSKYTRVANTVPPSTRYFTDTKTTDRTISDLVFFQDRLAFCSDEYVSFSRAGDYFNFWHHSATTLQPDDPIDVSALSQKVSKIYSMTPFSRALILSSATTQFYLTSNGALTPTTVSITAATEYDASTKIKPVTLGASMFIPAKQSGYFKLNEYYLFEGQAGYLANNVAEAVDTFIPDDADIILAQPLSDTLFVFSSSQKQNLFAYKAEWEDNKKKTSAWARWVFTDNILGLTAIGSRVYLITQRSSNEYLGVIDMSPTSALVSPNPVTEQPGYRYEFDIHLDYRETTTAITYDSVAKTSTVTVPLGAFFGFSAYEPLVAVVRRDTGEDYAVETIGVSSGLTTLTVKGDLLSNGNTEVYTGIRYPALFTLSPIYYRDREGAASNGIILKLRNIGISFGYTGMFQVEVTPYKRDPYTYTYSGINVGTYSLGRLGLTFGTTKFPVMSDGITAKIALKDNSVYPCSFLGYFWEGMYSKRA